MRYARPDEFGAIAALDGASFGFVYTEQDIEDAKLDVDLDAMLVALDGDRIVGASCEVPLQMTLPDGQVDTVGLTWVSVEVTHRRRGILRAMIERQVRDYAAQGMAAMILTASEGGIYGRYGFGCASQVRKVVIDRRAAQLLHPLKDHGVTRITTDQARELLPPLYERWRRQTPGAVLRNDKRWQIELMDREYQRNGMSALFHLLHRDGYVSYRIRSDWSNGHPQHAVFVTDYAPITADGHAALWQVLLGTDLSATIESYRIPLGDPLPYLLADPRRVRTAELNDGLWVRPLDVPTLLSARSFALDIDVALHVRDPFLGDGTYRLTGGLRGSQCTPTDDEPDAHIEVADLGAVCLGGTRLAPLFAAGRVRCDDPSLAVRLDRAFLADISPQLGTSF